MKALFSQKHSNIFLVLAVVLVSAMLIANVATYKQVDLGWAVIPGGSFIFIFTYVASDILSEVYGYGASRRIAWLGFAMNAMMVIVFQITIMMPSPVWFDGADAFAKVLGNTPIVFLAGAIAFQAGDWLNDVVFQKVREYQFKRGQKGNFGFVVRAVSSSFVGEVVDSALFLAIALGGRAMPWSELPMAILMLAAAKTVYEILVSPLTAILANKIKKIEGEGAFVKTQTYGLFGGKPLQEAK